MGKQKACLKISTASANIFLLPCPLKRGGPSLSRYMTTLLPLLSLGSKESCNKGESLPPIPLPLFFVDVVLTVFKRDQALTLVGETMELPRDLPFISGSPPQTVFFISIMAQRWHCWGTVHCRLRPRSISGIRSHFCCLLFRCSFL